VRSDGEIFVFRSKLEAFRGDHHVANSPGAANAVDHVQLAVLPAAAAST